MNTFEEHQLFIPIISDSRFAHGLVDACRNGQRGIFNRHAFVAVHKIRVEADLSVSIGNHETVQQELWEYYKRLEDEERAAQAHITLDAKPSQAERELSDWKQHAARVYRATNDLLSNPAWAEAEAARQEAMATTFPSICARTRMSNPPQQIPKESPIMATPTFNTITYISGKPLNELTNDELIQAIKACEKEIDSLREVKRTSTKVAAKIAELDSTADKIRDALDARA